VGSAGLAAATLAVAGCVPDAVTAEGRAVATLYAGFVVIAAVVGAIVFGLLTFAILRYRGGPERGLPPQDRGHWRLEAIWTGLPVLAVVGLFGATLVVLGRVDARSEAPAAEIRVEAFRWGWTFRYPSERITISGIGRPGPEVVVPVGEPVRVTLAATDVVHAFFVPQFLFKRDAIPGRENVFEFTVEDPGTYRGQCAEFCGIGHARMPFAIRAVPRPDYDAWLAAQPRDAVSAGPSASP